MTAFYGVCFLFTLLIAMLRTSHQRARGGGVRSHVYVPPHLRGGAPVGFGAPWFPEDQTAPMLQIQWNALPLATRQRLLAARAHPSSAGCIWLGAVRRETAPQRGGYAAPSGLPNAFLAWCVVLCPMALLIVWIAGYGDPHSELLWEGGVSLGLYAASLGLLAGGLAHVARRLWERVDRPIADGALLCPTALLEFRGAYLRVHSLAHLKSIRLDDLYGENRQFVGSSGRMRYYRVTQVYRSTDATVTFPDAELAFSSVGRLRDFLLWAEQSLQSLSAQPLAHQLASLHALDPIADARNHPAWASMLASGAGPRLRSSPESGPSCGVSRPTPWVLRPHWAVLAAFAVVAGSATWLLRNDLSDTAGYEVATSEGATGYRAYLANGWLFTREAQDALPFAEAVAHSDPARALRTFLREHPRHARAAEAQSLLHARFQRAATDYAPQAALGDPAVLSFVQRALAFQERNGASHALVRLAPDDLAAVAAFDAEAATLARLRGDDRAPLAPRFALADMRPREIAVISALQHGFAAVFPEGILAVDGDFSPAATPSPPRIRFDVTYGVSHTGEYMARLGDAQMTVGAVFEFRVVATVPDGGAPFVFATHVHPSAGVLGMQFLPAPMGDRVGAAACDRAFGIFSDRLLAAFFRVGSPALPATRPDSSPSASVSAQLPERWTATLTDLGALEPARVHVAFTSVGERVTGTFRGARHGPRVADGTLDGVLAGQTLTATCADVTGATGPCTFDLSPVNARITGMWTVAGARRYWADVRTR